MGDALIFIAILFVFYLGECVLRFPRTHFLLQASFWWVPNPGRASSYFGAETWGLFLIHPLPPLSSVFLVPDWGNPKNGSTLKEALDEKQLKQALDNYRTATRWLRMICNGLFWYICFIVPAGLPFLGGMYLLPAIAGLVVLFVIPAGVFFYRAHGRLMEGSSEDLFNVMVPVLLFPPATIRACDRLSTHFFKDFHPLLTAYKFATPEQFRRFAGPYLRDLKFPFHAEPPADDTLKELGKFLKKRGMSLDEFLDPGSPENEESESYCPRCLEEYLRSDGTCSDCPGVRLQPLK